ncbi:RagB/SusD family nutrient uptake outer membrane protein [Flavobacterium nackdongense]|uniref:RagB/SusD family nutrient uptake outer membrane protein n=1 Tax=Flavobacterium nackdongense TaxID=2547394 RepID=A0A4P6YHH8_9FLAO|nr:RagB/SusD family nutrient uptake outer membrane protein [Flavobacterium nackdongense]QBN20307.1 RagB/SusD family nutrient uptake outer membrane protein [Flavobacterium nackdongense]
MKTKKLLFSIAVALLILSSCDDVEFGDKFLEKEPSVDVTKDTIFSSVEFATRYLTRGYTTLPYGLNLDWGAKDDKLGMDILESLSDLNQSYLSWGGPNQLYYSGQYAAASENTSNSTKYHYTKENSWVGIRIGWNFIENADKIPAPDEATKNLVKRMKAEAKMIIALHYTDMYRHFGGLPWVDRTYSPADETTLPRLTSLETMNKIVALIEEAEPDLPWVYANTLNDDGRFTRASALGLKARLLLFGASPLFNSGTPYMDGEAAAKKLVWHGSEDPNLWKRAADAAKELMDQGYYGLVSTGNFRKDFQDAYYKRGTKEMLISTRQRYRSGGYWTANYYFYQSAGGYGTGCPTKEYVDMFPMKDGTPINDPNSGYNPNMNPWENRDPRLYETVLVNGDYYQGRTAQLWIGGLERTTLAANGSKTGFGLRKFLLERDAATSMPSIVHWPYLRMAEIYLTYAEAINEFNGSPTPEAYAAVDIVRNRVGLGDLPKGLSKEAFREAVLTERACEFGWEEVRWFDLIRHKKANLFQRALHGVNTTKNANGTYSYETVELQARHWKNTWSPKWYLSAFPPNEVNKGYGLVQNPGW